LSVEVVQEDTTTAVKTRQGEGRGRGRFASGRDSLAERVKVTIGSGERERRVFTYKGCSEARDVTDEVG
jgi:hypothetical protein